VIHGADEAAGTALLLLAAFPLEATSAVARLMGVAVAKSTASVVAVAAIAAAGYVTRIVLRALTVAIAKLLLPAFAAGAVLLLAALF